MLITERVQDPRVGESAGPGAPLGRGMFVLRTVVLTLNKVRLRLGTGSGQVNARSVTVSR